MFCRGEVLQDIDAEGVQPQRGLLFEEPLLKPLPKGWSMDADIQKTLLKGYLIPKNKKSRNKAGLSFSL